MLYLIWTIALLSAVYLYLRKVYSKLSDMEVRHLPVVPVLGNIGFMILRRHHFVYFLEKIHKTFPCDRIVGSYEFMNPTFIIKDLELIKRITVKDFEHFVDRRGFTNDFQDPLFAKSLLFLTGDEWKAMRATLSPAFTSSKIRLMVPFMVEVTDVMIQHLSEKIEQSGVGYIDVDMKDLSTRYSNDVISTCAFGLKINSFEEDNIFYVKSKEGTNFNVRDFFKMMIIRTFPRIAAMLKMTLSSNSVSDFFKNLVLDTMKQREEQNITRNDMIHLLMQAKKGTLCHDHKDTNDTDAGFATVEESALGKMNSNYEWNDEYLVAQAFLFLIAGFETVSTVLSFILHELALHPDIQDKLYREIKNNHDYNNGKIDYNSIQKMAYLDMVVSESLRLWPPAPAIDRRCVKDCNLGKPNETAQKDVIIRKGSAVQIFIWATHRDPNYFPDPEKFDPERFSDANKHNIKPYTYMPFGLGPRNCIGSRFALCEVKVMVYQLLLNLEVAPCGKTCIPARVAPDSIQMRMCGGHWLRLQPRRT